VAVLGGGCGGLAAAWALTATPELRARFDVTVYQMAWRLGGKGASGRMPHGDGAGGYGQRIEEHGLHIWFGFYAHAFRMLRQAYEEAGLAAGDDWWKTPFQKCDAVSLYERIGDQSWVRQPVAFPSRSSTAGPPIELERSPLARTLAHTTRMLATGLRSELTDGVVRRGIGGPAPGDPELGGAIATLDELADEFDRVPDGDGTRADDAAPVAGVTRGLLHPHRPDGGYQAAVIERAVERLRTHVEQLHESAAIQGRLDTLRLWRGALEMMAAALAGILRDGLLSRGLGVIDDEDLRQWLGRHGAKPETLERTPLLRGLYDLTFAYRNGDKRHPSLAAGKGLQSMLMMINYDGAFMWRMRAGMGDVVFSPLYLALKQRGVHFHFFSRVTGLRLGPVDQLSGRQAVDEIDLVREATVTAGVDGYEPLEQFGDWWCWPGQPRVDQLSEHNEKPDKLVRGDQFDEVVLAIPVGAQHQICGELAAANPRFKQMLDDAETVRTKGLQIWLTKPIEELRARPGEAALDPPATAYAEPFDTYCDMSHLLAPEGFGEAGPKGVAYFCAVLPDEIPASEVEQAVRSQARQYIEEHARAFWPGAFDDGRFDWNVLFDPQERVGPERLEAQYVRANVEPTDRYVTTPAGSVGSRLDPGASGFDHLVLAGDWTHNEIDGGCVEAAVISGERAGAALIEADHAGVDQFLEPAAGIAPAGPGGAPVPQHAPSSSPSSSQGLPRYVEYGALATAPGPLLCEAARLYCFFLNGDRERVQELCDRVLQAPTGGALRYRVPRLAPVILSFGSIGGLRSLEPSHSGRGSAFEPEAAIWIPTIAQRLEGAGYVDDHLAVFMPYIWVDDPIAFASGREVYGFAKTQGWMPDMGDPRNTADRSGSAAVPDPPEELYLDVYGTEEYQSGAELGQKRLITVRRPSGVTRGLGSSDSAPRGDSAASVDELAGMFDHFVGALDPSSEAPGSPHVTRSLLSAVGNRVAGAVALGGSLTGFMAEKVVRHVFLKQFRDAKDGQAAVLQQVVEAQSSVTPGSLRWRRLGGAHEVAINRLATQPLEADLGLELRQQTRLAFGAEFGFRMEPGRVVWPR
jgi:uncharacterized protein with NAD-binding domain and iron-sulfur cluster